VQVYMKDFVSSEDPQAQTPLSVCVGGLPDGHDPFAVLLSSMGEGEAARRLEIASLLLEHGADPTWLELETTGQHYLARLCPATIKGGGRTLAMIAVGVFDLKDPKSIALVALLEALGGNAGALVAPPVVAPPVAPTTNGCGLSNLGNTCFSNAAVQFLRPALACLPIGAADRLPLLHLARLLCAEPPVLPQDLDDATRQLLKHLHGFRKCSFVDGMKVMVPVFTKGQQHDAHEAIVAVVGDLEAGLAEIGATALFSATETSLLNCAECKATPVATSAATGGCISLPVQSAEGVPYTTLLQGLVAWNRAEELSKDNRSNFCNCTCERMKKGEVKECTCIKCVLFHDILDPTPQTKQMWIGASPPPARIILHFTRFKFSTTLNLTIKQNHPIAFDEEVNLAPFMETKARRVWYELEAVLQHHGAAAAIGHCTAVRRGADGKFYLFDDYKPVREVQLDEELFKQAYLVVYRLRVDVPPIPPAVPGQGSHDR
jgi:ubiquitin C-terminal hydrolase